MPEFRLSGSARLRSIEEADADELYALVEANRAHLSPWMPWAARQTREGTLEFIRTARRQLEAGEGFQLALAVDERLAGVFGYHDLDRENLRVAIGYWLAAEAQGSGLATEAVRALVDHAFADWRLHRVEIRAAVGNARSIAICDRLGFVEEGILREAQRFEDRYRDLVVHSILASDWPGVRSAL